MKRTEKESFVETFRERLKGNPAVFLTDFTGLDVKSMTVLRDELRKNGAEYLVVKNRLVRRALEELDIPDLAEWLTGPTGVVIGSSGPVEAAKAVTDFAKSHDQRPTFKVGILDNALLDPSQIEHLAQLPPRDVLLAMLAGALESPMAALAGALEAKLQEMAGLLKALKEKQEGGSA
ncbi:50S ribosomal protein L10 [Gemmatimonadota bacterium]